MSQALNVRDLPPNALLTRVEAAMYVPNKSSGEAVADTIVRRCLSDLAGVHPLEGLVRDDKLTPTCIERIIEFRANRTAYKAKYAVEMPAVVEIEAIDPATESAQPAPAAITVAAPTVATTTLARPGEFSAAEFRASATSALTNWQGVLSQMQHNTSTAGANRAEMNDAAKAIGQVLGAQTLATIAQSMSGVVADGLPAVQAHVLQMAAQTGNGNADGGAQSSAS